MATPEDPELLHDQLIACKIETGVEWPPAFPKWAFTPCDPVKLSKRIYEDVAKLKSISEAGRKAIHDERCARAGITVDGVPCFYIDRTRL